MPPTLCQLAPLVLLVASVALAASAPPASGTWDELDEVTLRLFSACGRNSYAKVVEAIRAGARVNARAERGQTPLMSAALTGNAQSIRALLEAPELDATIGEEGGYTPLHGAAFQGRPEAATLLLGAGKRVPNEMHADGFFPIHRATWGNEKRHTDTVRAFLEMGVSPNTLTLGGETVLEVAEKQPRRNEATIALLREWARKMKDEEEREEL